MMHMPLPPKLSLELKLQDKREDNTLDLIDEVTKLGNYEGIIAQITADSFKLLRIELKTWKVECCLEWMNVLY